MSLSHAYDTAKPEAAAREQDTEPQIGITEFFNREVDNRVELHDYPVHDTLSILASSGFHLGERDLGRFISCIYPGVFETGDDGKPRLVAVSGLPLELPLAPGSANTQLEIQRECRGLLHAAWARSNLLEDQTYLQLLFPFRKPISKEQFLRFVAQVRPFLPAGAEVVGPPGFLVGTPFDHTIPEPAGWKSDGRLMDPRDLQLRSTSKYTALRAERTSVSATTCASRARAMMRRRTDGSALPVPLPWTAPTRMLCGGLYPRAVHVAVAARHVDLTQAALQITNHAAANDSVVMYISFVAGAEEIGARLTGISSGNCWRDAWTGKDEEAWCREEYGGRDRFRHLPLRVMTPAPGQWKPESLLTDLADLNAWYSPVLHHDHGRLPRPSLVVIDDLQSIGGDTSVPLAARIEAVARVARRVSEELNAAVLLLSRAGAENTDLLREGRHERVIWKQSDGNKTIEAEVRFPGTLVGLGEGSREVEFSADTVLVLVEDPHPQRPQDGSSTMSLAIAQQRLGSPGWTSLNFDGNVYVEPSDDTPAESVQVWGI